MLVRINAPAAIDATGVHIAPASLLLHADRLHADRLHADDEAAESSRSDLSSPNPALPPSTLHANLHLEALATPAEVDAHLRAQSAEPARTLNFPSAILTPALVNAHTHLDLTHIGPQPFDPAQGFTGFIKLVLANRLADRDAIQISIAAGAALSLKGGVAAVGDIAGVVAGKPSAWPILALADTPLHGVAFLEFFGIGAGETGTPQSIDAAMRELAASASRVRVGFQPHAPYTASPRVYAEASIRAASSSRPAAISTHVAETPEERDLITRLRGPFRDFLERVGWWSDAIAADYEGASSPIAYFLDRLAPSRDPSPAYSLAHVNDCSDADIARLARSNHSIAYCPRSSTYFRNHEHFGPHRYRDMLAAGINVCLGTDSVINLPNTDRISTLDEARFLFARDAFDPRELLAMATIRGARALGLPESAFRFTTGATLAGLLAIPAQTPATDPWAAIMRSAEAPILLALHSAPL
jgi:cytosine/adenosine deaminase-related metal-dependent hydrolase